MNEYKTATLAANAAYMKEYRKSEHTYVKRAYVRKTFCQRWQQTMTMTATLAAGDSDDAVG